jgi:hypothetical protein
MPAPMAAPPAASLTKNGCTLARQNADAQYKLDKEACASPSGNAKVGCVTSAKVQFGKS